MTSRIASTGPTHYSKRSSGTFASHTTTSEPSSYRYTYTVHSDARRHTSPSPPTSAYKPSLSERMDGVNIPSETVPASLKTCEQILKRAKEVKKAEPVVAYWCCYSAAQKAIKMPNRSTEDTNFLVLLVEALEQMRKILGNNEAVTNEAAGAAHIENFALKVFMSADNDDRKGITGKATIRKFVVAGQFIEVLRCFENGMTEEMEQKLQYARWKAADGAKALREGRDPASGPPMPEAEPTLFPSLPGESPSLSSDKIQPSPPADSNVKISTQAARGSFSSATRPTVAGNGGSSTNSSQQNTPIVSPRPSPGQLRGNLPAFDTTPRDNLHTPSRTQSAASGAWSTVATPGIPDDESSEIHFDINRQGQPSASAPPLTPPDKGSPSGERKNVRFMGPDGAPLSPASTHITVESYDAPPPPPGTDIASPNVSPRPSPHVILGPPPAARPQGDSSASSSSRPGNGANGNNGNGATTGTAGSRQRRDSSASNATATRPIHTAPTAARSPNPAPPSIHVPPPPPPSLASYPIHPPAQVQPHGLGLTSPPPAPAPQAKTITSLSRKEVEQTQKHAKFAISALNFDDLETARSELKKALQILGG